MPRLSFQKKLVLNQWMLGLFGCETLELLADRLKDDAVEGYDENNVSYFYYTLVNNAIVRNISKDELMIYDENIYRHTQQLNKYRGTDKIQWKYFQYLALLFTEVYLDRYFRDSGGMLGALNDHVSAFNQDKSDADCIDEFAAADLRRIAFFQATGSGKTLLMHINIMQYEFYLKKRGRQNELNRIILLTPNEGLSHQHLAEFKKSAMLAKPFEKNSSGGFLGNQFIEVIDVHKLGDKMGDKTVDVAAFEGNNLVLVDEGHRGSSGEEWMKRREKLSKDGFSFEYSATFEQAISASRDKALEQQYAKAILFNYSYKYFYADGFGKDYKILNLDENHKDEATRRLYLTACMVSFYQQIRFFQDQPAAVKKYNLEKPLLVLVGARVNVGVQDVSDLEFFLCFLANFIKNESAAIADLDMIMKDEHGLYAGDKNIFSGAFDYLRGLNQDSADLLADMKLRVFHNAAGGAFTIEHLKGSGGEIALRLGDSKKPFGVINVGAAKKLVDKCKMNELFDVRERTFSQSYFRDINDITSSINVLIGAKKFTEGWSSWRVSTMGLLKVGQSEGSQIIQLFGRGVRLKGINFSLKRSSKSPKGSPQNAPLKYIKQLETLNVFGVQAGYMAQFRDFLAAEDASANNEMVDIILPLHCDYDESKNLKILRLNKDANYKQMGPRPVVGEKAEVNKVVLNWYPKVQANISNGAGEATEAERTRHKFTDRHIKVLDINQIFFDMQLYKNIRDRHNLNISRKHICDLLLDEDWYDIEIPPERMDFSDNIADDIARWQEIAESLMRKYSDRTYGRERMRWENKHLEYQDLKKDDKGNMLWDKDANQHQYVISVKADQENTIEDIKTLGTNISEWKLNDAGDFEPRVPQKFNLLSMVEHLYQPLIHLKKGTEHITIKPTALNDGEKDFVKDLGDYIKTHKDFLAGKELYLLRNQSRGAGIGFFKEVRFYPDFILWIVDGAQQYISFIDPHGLRNTNANDPRINLHKDIKNIQKELKKSDKNIRLNSFIVSTTLHGSGSWVDTYSKDYFETRNVFFQDGANADYINRIIKKSLMQEGQ